MNLDELVAIDVRVRAEASCCAAPGVFGDQP